MGIGYVLGWVRLVGGQANRATYRGMGMGKSMGMGMGMVWYGGGAIDHTHTHTPSFGYSLYLSFFFSFLLFQFLTMDKATNHNQSNRQKVQYTGIYYLFASFASLPSFLYTRQTYTN